MFQFDTALYPKEKVYGVFKLLFVNDTEGI